MYKHCVKIEEDEGTKGINVASFILRFSVTITNFVAREAGFRAIDLSYFNSTLPFKSTITAALNIVTDIKSLLSLTS